MPALFANLDLARRPILERAILFVGLLGVLMIAITPLPMAQQAILALGLMVVCAVLAKRPEGWARVMLAIIAVAVASRYLYWRVTETLEFRSAFEAFLGYGLVAAELYLFAVLVLGVAQTLEPRERKPAALPADPELWPTVDVFIPTYNEPLSVVSATVLAAQRMDYPLDKLKIHLLDDGRRDEFRAFAKEAGVNYITRTDNKHAKAGNLNNALKQTNGDLIAIFDCDHIPTRGFLQLSIGWFLKNPKMGMLQTPHHFYSQDPFEKNLKPGAQLSNEGLLFYGVVQDGNDFWNASFFCGSCAVLRREAIEEIGGIAVETVTEDAHTSLKMQRRGWSTGYLRRPLAAGLATGSLAAHIGQRMRWARGMIQIFRVDNPLTGPGLSFMQRICYLNAMAHFMFPLPRLVLLTAPLAFLLLGQQTIFASTGEILAYAGPYLVIATMSSMRTQGRHRQPLWGEIYEAVLALHLVIPVVMTFLRPGKGKFNVTSKNLLKGRTMWDWSTTKTHLALLVLTLGAVFYGIAALVGGDLPANVASTTAINVAWAVISAFVLAICVGVGLERRELRESPRIGARLPVTVYLADGRALAAETVDISAAGAAIRIPGLAGADLNDLGVELMDRNASVYVPAQAVEASRDLLRVRFAPEGVDQQRGLVCAVFGRTDAWKGWDERPAARLGDSIRLMGSALSGFLAWAIASLAPAPRRGRAALAGASAALALAAAAAFTPQTASAQAPSSPAPSSPAPSTQAPAAAPIAVAPAPNAEPRLSRTITMSLDDFGVLDPLRLQGRSNTRGVGFTLRSDQVVTSARLTIPIAHSPSLDPANSQLTISLNGQVVHAVALDALDGVSETIEFDVNPFLFLRDNNLVFRLQARRSGADAKCDDDEMVWAQISDKAQITLTTQRVPLAADLSHLPMPFFDRRDSAELRLPFVFSGRPSIETIEAAGVVSSYWGMEASYRGARFPVRFNALPADNAVVFATQDERIAGLELPPIAGPTLAVVPNPTDPDGRLLLVLGRDGVELMAAARALSVGSGLLAGASAPVRAPELSPRAAYDAPRWIPNNRPVKLGEFTDVDRLEGRGVSPGVLTANVRLAPDFFAWENRGVPLRVRFRHPGEQWIDLDKSRLDVLVNDKYITSFSLKENQGAGLLSLGRGSSQVQEASAMIPPYLLFGETRLQFFFDLQPRKDGACTNDPAELRTSIDPDTEIDLRGLDRYTRMPNLAFLAQSGFPFTRMADLSESVVVLSPDYVEQDLEALFMMLGFFGDRTGAPATRLQLAFPSDIERFSDRDILLIGAYNAQPLLKTWSDAAGVQFSDDRAVVRARSPIERAAGHFRSALAGRPPADRVEAAPEAMASLMMSFRSPLDPKRTVVAVAASDPAGLVRIAEALRTPERSPAIQGDLALISGEKITSFAVAEPYYVGSLPPLKMVTWQIASNPWAMPATLGLSLCLVTLGSLALVRRRIRDQAREDGEGDDAAK